ncbi:MAG: hypothetical protein ACLFSE_06385 [Spirochaetia bacterium]
MVIQRTGEYTVQIEKEGEKFLGINTRIKSGGFGLKRFLSSEGPEKMWIISPNGVEQWGPMLATEYEGSVILYGPYHETVSLTSVLKTPSRDTLPYLKNLAEAVPAYREKNPGFSRICTFGILFLDGTGTDPENWKILFLPEEMTDIILDNQDEQKRMIEFEVYNHPDMKKDLNIAFSLGTMSYRILTGEFAFFSDSEVDIHDRMRNKQIPAPRMKNPEIKQEVSDFIYQNITPGPGKKIGTLTDWKIEIEKWIKEGVRTPVTEEETAELRRNAEEAERKWEKNYRRKMYVQRNWRRGLVIVAAAALILSLPISIISNALKPRMTAGFSPEEVIEAFYYGMNSLDHSLMEDAVAGNAGKSEIREAMNLYVMTRERYSVEGTTGLTDPRLWLENDRPYLPQGTNIYGVSNLEIEELPDQDDNEETKLFRAEYIKWTPVFGSYSEDDSPNVSKESTEAYERIDRIHMIKSRGDWVIDDIDRQKDELVESL